MIKLRLIKTVLITTLLILLIFTSCNRIQTIKLMTGGEVEQEEFNVEIPFEYRLGLIILKVNISGKEYDFMLDTGAPNVISLELAQKLELINLSKQEVGDSQGVASDLGFSKIEKLSIGGIHFLNTGTAIADLKLSTEVNCLKVDGFIGSNLMNKAIWKFDYQNQIITISNSIESLNIPKSNTIIPFSTKMTGTPIIDIQLNGITENDVTVDLGSNRDISLSKNTFDELTNTNTTISQTYSFGNSASGLYGKGKADTIHYIKAPSVSFGDVSLENTIVKFTNKSASTVGTEFFRNYDLIINWFTKEILLIDKTKYENSTLSSFGFSYSYKNNKLIVDEVYEKMKDIKLGDEILKIDEVKYNSLLPNQWCEIIDKGLFLEKEKISISILRDNKELSFILKKEMLL